jgi:APA family basic amino acid/polyamine antiporter
MVVVSLVIGIGIFRTPAMVADAAGTPAAFLGAWLLGGLLSLAGALTFAEIGSRCPRAGGYYKVVAECYHPALAFMLNWAQALMQGAGAAGVAYIGAEYLGHLLVAPASPTPRQVQLGALMLMVVLLALNFSGLRTGARAQNALSLLKTAMIAALGLAALSVVAQAPVAPATTPASWAGFASAAVAVFYTYGGYQGAMNLGGDVRDARRALPRAVIAGMLLVTALYLLLNGAYLGVLGIDGLRQSPLAAASLARATLGASGERLVSLAIFLSAAGFVNATILQVPRSYYAMAQDGVLPRAFLALDERTQVQPVGLAFFALTMLLPALLLGSFERLLNYVMFSDALMLLAVASTLVVLRRRTPIPEPGVFRASGYPWLPGLFMLAMLGVATRVLLTDTQPALIGLAILLAGGPLYALARRVNARA